MQMSKQIRLLSGFCVHQSGSINLMCKISLMYTTHTLANSKIFSAIQLPKVSNQEAFSSLRILRPPRTEFLIREKSPNLITKKICSLVVTAIENLNDLFKNIHLRTKHHYQK